MKRRKVRFSVTSQRTPFNFDRTTKWATSILNISIYIVSIYQIFTGFRLSHLLFQCIGTSLAVYSQCNAKLTLYRCTSTVLASIFIIFTFTDTNSGIAWFCWNLLLFVCVFIRKIADSYRSFNIHLWDECLPCFD